MMITQLRSGTPAQAGFSAARIKRLADLCQGWVADGSTPALMVMVARRGVIFLHEAWGRLGPEPDSPPVLRDAIFGTASVSKIVTATAVMMLVEQGRLGIHQPVQKYLPELIGPGCEKIQVRHLLTHTSGLPKNSPAPLLEIGRNGLEQEPGQKMVYSNPAFDLLGMLVERVSGLPFYEFTRLNIFEPLGMRDTTFIQMGSQPERCVQRRPGSNYDWPTEMIGTVSPSGTLWSTSMDMGIFLQTYLNGGSYGGYHLLSPATIAAMTRNQIPGIPREMQMGMQSPPCGFGWFMLGETRFPSTPCLWSPHSYGHAGASGAFIWADPVYDISGVFFFTKTNPEINHLDLFVDALMGALLEADAMD